MKGRDIGEIAGWNRECTRKKRQVNTIGRKKRKDEFLKRKEQLKDLIEKKQKEAKEKIIKQAEEIKSDREAWNFLKKI